MSASWPEEQAGRPHQRSWKRAPENILITSACVLLLLGKLIGITITQKGCCAACMCRTDDARDCKKAESAHVTAHSNAFTCLGRFKAIRARLHCNTGTLRPLHQTTSGQMACTIMPSDTGLHSRQLGNMQIRTANGKWCEAATSRVNDTGYAAERCV